MIFKGEKILLSQRRIFKLEIRRLFIGEVEGASDVAIRAHGYSFVFDDSSGEYVRWDDLRTRIISVTDAGNVIFIVPKEVNIGEVRFKFADNQRFITDGKSFNLSMSEFGVKR